MASEVERPAYLFISAKYPGLGPYESWLWTQFLRKTHLTFTKIEYNVRVGPGYDPGPKYPDYIREMALALTKLKIDAVGHRRHEIIIFEIKPRAGRSALGQIISYLEWYIRDYKPTKPVRGAVVCEFVDPNLEPIFMRRGIQLYILGEGRYSSDRFARKRRQEIIRRFFSRGGVGSIYR